jgi:hypothetical protein
MRRYARIIAALAALAALVGCPNPSGGTPESDAKAITAFSFSDPPAVGVIDEANHSIAVAVPYGTDLSGIAPTIVHTGASVSPASGMAQDFTSPVIYTVTAADGSAQVYTVMVTAQLNAVKRITLFAIESVFSRRNR